MINSSNQFQYRSLLKSEIEQLIGQGCSSTDWSLIKISKDFSADYIENVHFTGNIRLNGFRKIVSLANGINIHTGIYKAWLHNCDVGEDVLIYNVRSYIANYKIGVGAVIFNVTAIETNCYSTFGNGILVNTISEDGGRSVPIYNDLSSHIGYLLAMYRHRPLLINNLKFMINQYVDSIRSEIGEIGSHTKIINCSSLINVNIGPYAKIQGANKLENGSVNSSKSAPIKIGEGVIMTDFIISSGASITDATLISKCFIGQGSMFDKSYSAINSLFFSNCQGFHGEASSIFAGPYTVSHHKSTLLIAGIFSFMNAGSGSNQSNHQYKLGPIHQGVVERGSKTTSGSYLLWPSRIGAFSLIMGRHYNHCDTSDFPFSYLVEKKDESYLIPAMNLKSIGTVRDTQKWPFRDNRTDSILMDNINFNLLSPYTVQKMIKGREKLLAIQQSSGKFAEQYSYEKMKIEGYALERGILLYEMAIWKFLGNSLISRLENKTLTTTKELRNALIPNTEIGTGKWADLSGLLCPLSELEKIIGLIENRKFNGLDDVSRSLNRLHEQYYRYEWTWAADILSQFYGKNILNFIKEDVVLIVEKWKEAVLGIDRMLYEDAKKEFSLTKMIGFGVDGQNGAQEQDFAQVRGEFEKNETIKTILKHIQKKELLGDTIIEQMRHK